MKHLSIAISLLILFSFPAFPQIGAISYCPDNLISAADSLWVVQTAEAETPRDSLTIPPRIISGFTPQPAYPDSALAASISGQIIVAAYVSTLGDVMAWQSLRVDPQGWGFEEAVEQVICRWKFAPAVREQKPVNARVGIPFNFKPEATR